MLSMLFCLVINIVVLFCDASRTFLFNNLWQIFTFGVNFNNGYCFVDTDTCFFKLINVNVSLLQFCDDLEWIAYAFMALLPPHPIQDIRSLDLLLTNLNSVYLVINFFLSSFGNWQLCRHHAQPCYKYSILVMGFI